MLVLVHVIMIKGAPIALDSGFRILLHVKPKVIAWVINNLNGIRNVNNLVVIGVLEIARNAFPALASLIKLAWLALMTISVGA